MSGTRVMGKGDKGDREWMVWIGGGGNEKARRRGTEPTANQTDQEMRTKDRDKGKTHENLCDDNNPINDRKKKGRESGMTTIRMSCDERKC